MKTNKIVMIMLVTFAFLSGCVDKNSIASTTKKEQARDKNAKVLHFKAQDNTKLEAGAELISDTSAPCDKVVKVPLNAHSWAAHWSLDSANFRNVDYLIRMKVKADKISNEGTAFSCGIFSVTRGIGLLKQIIDSSEISGSDYRWLDCGNINGNTIDSAYFYIAQLSPSAIKNLYVCAIEFVPESSPLYKAKVRKEPMHLSKAAAKVDVGDVVNLKVSAVKQLLYPAKKVLDGNSEVLSVSPDTDYWSTKWHIFNHLAPGKYSVRALVKLKGPKEGRGIRFGIYSPKLKKALFDREIPTTQIPVTDKYQWLNLGLTSIVNDNSSYMFVCSLGDHSFDSFFVKTIEFTRIE